MSDKEPDDAVGVAGQNVLDALGAAQAALEEQKAQEQRFDEECHEALLDLLLNKGLYYSVDTKTPLGERLLHDLREASTTSFDCYCVGCRREAPFRISTSNDVARKPVGRFASKVPPASLFATRAVCQRSFHVYTYIFTVLNDRLLKIGQFPSLADIAHGELRSIDKGLDDADRRELGKALGLFAHDTALGAFVYLRRVFERMIQRAHERQSGSGNPVEGFADMKMHERIAALKNELPEKVVQNSAVFSVLSIGLHELTEEQCAKHFPVMKAVLFQMLEQEEHKRLAAITARETEAALQKILSDPRA